MTTTNTISNTISRRTTGILRQAYSLVDEQIAAAVAYGAGPRLQLVRCDTFQRFAWWLQDDLDLEEDAAAAFIAALDAIPPAELQRRAWRWLWRSNWADPMGVKVVLRFEDYLSDERPVPRVDSGDGGPLWAARPA